MTAGVLKKIQKQKGQKNARKRQNQHIFEVIPFVKLQNDT